MNQVTVYLEPHHVGCETGLWCDDCGLPSGVRHRFAVTARGGVAILDYQMWDVCDDCGRTL